MGNRLRLALIVLVFVFLLLPHSAHAAEPAGDFALQISPSPLVATVKPGETSVLELKIRNGGTGTENLKVEPRSFTFDSSKGTVRIDDTAPPEISRWISFAAPNFTVQPGEWYTQKVRIAVPKEAGFSYSFALIISRTNNQKPVESGQLIKGSVADFTLINVDRPGSTRKLDIASFESSKGLYEYLPADFTVRFKNSGNSIVQPYGNIFIQRGSGDETPISTLKVNESKAYILPDTTRGTEASWNDGFPVYRETTSSDGTKKRSLFWDWDKLSQLRIGKYTAKLVAVYNDGSRDIPVERTVTFWVVPWRAILGFLVLVALVVVLGRWNAKRRTEKAVKRALAAQKAADQAAKVNRA